MVVAIDGPAGVGKSTLARHLSRRWNLHYLNTGRYYRAITVLALERGILSSTDFPESLLKDDVRCQTLVELASRVQWSLGQTGVIANGRELSSELHTSQVDAWVALVSEVPSLREVLNQHFRGLALDHDLVCEGRDVTSVIFPNATVRIFLDAEPSVRAQRRFSERAEGMSFEAILAAIESRDLIDRNKPVGALRLTPGCLLVDSSRLTIEAVCEKVDSIVREHRQ